MQVHTITGLVVLCMSILLSGEWGVLGYHASSDFPTSFSRQTQKTGSYQPWNQIQFALDLTLKCPDIANSHIPIFNCNWYKHDNIHQNIIHLLHFHLFIFFTRSNNDGGHGQRKHYKCFTNDPHWRLDQLALLWFHYK